MIPFCSSSAGGSHARSRDLESIGRASMLPGAPLGTVEREFGQCIQFEVMTNKLSLPEWFFL